MSIPLHPPQFVTDTHTSEPFFCRWEDGREIGSNCGQGVSEEDMPPHRLKNFEIFKLICAIWCILFAIIILKVNQFIKSKYLPLLYTAPVARTLLDGRRKGVKPLGAEGGVWGRCAPSEVENFCTFQTQFARLGEYFLSTFHRKKGPGHFQFYISAWGIRALS